VNYTSAMGRTICWFLLLGVACASDRGSKNEAPKITSAPAGPYQVQGNLILDQNRHQYLIRGTQMPAISAQTAVSPGGIGGYGSFSGTTFITLRQRMNMNAVRLPVDPEEYLANQHFRSGVKQIVQRANQFDLLAILEIQPAAAPAEAIASFWTRCAAEFKTNPNVFFALSRTDNIQQLVDFIRASGAVQPIIVPMASGIVQDPNAIYEVSSSYVTLREDQTTFDRMSGNVPLLASGLDPQLDHAGGECAAFPSDPGAAAALIENLLTYFDERSISWTISVMEPGRLIDNFAGYDWSKLDDGWTCGESPTYSGIGMTVLSHLWSTDAHGVLTVNQPGGGLVIARGANASAYGRTLAAREASAPGRPVLKLGGVSVRVTDSKGVARLARLMWTGAGWSSLNLIIPPESAAGPAEVTIVRADGSQTPSKIIIANVAPALWTGPNDGRGPVIGQVFQRSSDGSITQSPTWTCSKTGCQAVSIPLTSRVSTTVRLEGTGFRLTSSKAAIRVMIDGVAVPVESFGPMGDSTRDQVTIKLPNELIGRGEADVAMIADGALSNVARINCGRR
jgi:uncharacterized protein (TIGR03437 family)